MKIVSNRSQRIISRVALAALIATTFAPIAGADRALEFHRERAFRRLLKKSSLPNKPMTTSESISSLLIFLGAGIGMYSLMEYGIKKHMIANREFVDNLAKKLSENLETDLGIDIDKEFSSVNAGPKVFGNKGNPTKQDLSEKDISALREACIYFNFKKDKQAQLDKVKEIQARLNKDKPDNSNIKYRYITAGICACAGLGILASLVTK